MKAYKIKVEQFSGSNYKEVYQKAYYFFLKIKKRSKRRPYIRSAYFEKDKIFLGLFWQHLREKKNLRDKTRRLKYFNCGIELIENSCFEPISKENPNRRSEILHRFSGLTKEGLLFFVQIKEDKKTNQKWLMSIFPFKK